MLYSLLNFCWHSSLKFFYSFSSLWSGLRRIWFTLLGFTLPTFYAKVVAWCHPLIFPKLSYAFFSLVNSQKTSSAIVLPLFYFRKCDFALKLSFVFELKSNRCHYFSSLSVARKKSKKKNRSIHWVRKSESCNNLNRFVFLNNYV